MKKTIPVLLLLFLAGITNAQNVKSNDYIRAEVISNQQIKVTNLQTCPARVKGTLPNGAEVVSDYISSGGFFTFAYKDCGTFHFYPVDSTCTKVARCDLSINSCLFVLPVKAENNWRISSDKLYVEGEIKNATEGKKYKLKVTLKDGTIAYYPVPLNNKIGAANYSYKIKL